MRSGSSLLTHLLISNPEIAGFGESKICWSNRKDFDHLVTRVSYNTKNFKMNERFVLDKVLHNRLISQLDILNDERLKIIFLLREPERTLVSYLSLFKKENEFSALHYYQQRLNFLLKCAKFIGSQERSLFFTYDELINQTESIFKKIQSFIDLKYAISSNYKITKYTGVKNIGDSSEYIKSGKILKTPVNRKINISQSVIEQAQEHYSVCLLELRKYCSTINGKFNYIKP